MFGGAPAQFLSRRYARFAGPRGRPRAGRVGGVLFGKPPLALGCAWAMAAASAATRSHPYPPVLAALQPSLGTDQRYSKLGRTAHLHAFSR